MEIFLNPSKIALDLDMFSERVQAMPMLSTMGKATDWIMRPIADAIGRLSGIDRSF